MSCKEHKAERECEDCADELKLLSTYGARRLHFQQTPETLMLHAFHYAIEVRTTART